MNETRIFDSYKDFLARKDKTVNGVSPEFVTKHLDWEEVNSSNEGCYDCIRCIRCIDCIRCIRCIRGTKCYGCYDCMDCTKCIRCSGCYDCYDCIDCTECSGCTRCIKAVCAYNCLNTDWTSGLPKPTALKELTYTTRLLIYRPARGATVVEATPLVELAASTVLVEPEPVPVGPQAHNSASQLPTSTASTDLSWKYPTNLAEKFIAFSSAISKSAEQQQAAIAIIEAVINEGVSSAPEFVRETVASILADFIACEAADLTEAELDLLHQLRGMLL